MVLQDLSLLSVEVLCWGPPRGGPGAYPITKKGEGEEPGELLPPVLAEEGHKARGVEAEIVPHDHKYIGDESSFG
jgi:hypothetical protein